MAGAALSTGWHSTCAGAALALCHVSPLHAQDWRGKARLQGTVVDEASTLRPAAYFYRGRILFNRGQRSDAKRDFKQVLEIDPTGPFAPHASIYLKGL